MQDILTAVSKLKQKDLFSIDYTSALHVIHGAHLLCVAPRPAYAEDFLYFYNSVVFLHY